MLPATILLWWFSWSLVMNALFSQRPLNLFSDRASWRGVRLETSGTAEFTWVWAFKVLILVFAFLLFVQAVAFALQEPVGPARPGADVESHPKSDLTSEELAALAGDPDARAAAEHRSVPAARPAPDAGRRRRAGAAAGRLPAAARHLRHESAHVRRCADPSALTRAANPCSSDWTASRSG